MNQTDVHQGRILLGDVAAVVGGNVVRGQLAVASVSNHAYRVISSVNAGLSKRLMERTWIGNRVKSAGNAGQ